MEARTCRRLVDPAATGFNAEVTTSLDRSCCAAAAQHRTNTAACSCRITATTKLAVSDSGRRDSAPLAAVWPRPPPGSVSDVPEPEPVVMSPIVMSTRMLQPTTTPEDKQSAEKADTDNNTPQE